MGREWYWAGRSAKRVRAGAGGERDAPSGCMTAFSQFFDFYPFQFCLHHQQPSFKPHLPPSPYEDATIPKGVEAPRNSLESEEGTMNAVPLVEETLNIQMGIQVKTSGEKRSNDLSSESSYSPGLKTPSLVARLMGLDLLPDHNQSPTWSSSSSLTPNPPRRSQLHHQSRSSISRRDTDIMGTRSLPETPRMSSARRSDVDHHRLSLQINKENVSVSEELECSRFSCSSAMARRKDVVKGRDENRSPGHYAKQGVNRRVGRDITNTIRDTSEQGRDLENLILSKSKKYFKSRDEFKASTPPRLMLWEPKNRPLVSKLDQTPRTLEDSNSQLAKSSSKPLQKQEEQQQKFVRKCQKVTGERFGSRIRKLRNKQQEPFVRPIISDKKSKKTPLNITVSSTLVPVRRDPSPPATKLPQKQVVSHVAETFKPSSQLSSCTSQRYKQEATHMHTFQDKDHGSSICKGATTSGGGALELQYITRILNCTGIDCDTPVSFSRWFSPSHPLNPLIFHHLQDSTPTPTPTTGCNPKLIFDLVDEILAQILKPRINLKPWVYLPSISNLHQLKGCQLIQTLCSRIERFPGKNCQVLQDVDELIEKDLDDPSKYQTSAAFEEEGESIVSDIEKDITDSLVHETVVLYVTCQFPHTNGTYYATTDGC